MPYQYKARNNSGGLVEGSLEAASEREAMEQLRQMHLTPVRVEQKAVLVPAPVSVTAMPPLQAGRVRRIEVRDIMVFCTNFSTMINAGIPLFGALKVIAGQMKNPYLGSVIREVSRSVSEGASFSEALSGFPGVFSKFFINMVRVGEATGTMSDVFKALALYMERQEDLRQKIRGALIYPLILLTVGSCVIILILTFVMPQFVQIFEKSGVALPLPTKMMYGAGTWLQHYWFFPLGGLAVVILSIRGVLQTAHGKDLWHRTLLKLPVFGPLTQEILVARFSRTLGTLIDHGVPLLEALAILEDVIANTVFSRIVHDVRLSVEKGAGIHAALTDRREFPEDVVYMISVGEESGKIGQMLHKVADFYENKVEFTVKGVLVFIEPVFISFMAVCVGGMLASVILPMFDLVKTIQH